MDDDVLGGAERQRHNSPIIFGITLQQITKDLLYFNQLYTHSLCFLLPNPDFLDYRSHSTYYTLNMAPFLPPINQTSESQQHPGQSQGHHSKPKSFFEKERQYWIDVENLRLVRKIYKIDGSKNLSYHNQQMESKPTSYSLKQAKDRKKIEFENQRILARLSNLGTSHYSK